MTSKKAKGYFPAPPCPTCDSKNVLYRKKDKVYWCRKCGQEFRRIKGGQIRRVAYKRSIYPDA